MRIIDKIKNFFKRVGGRIEDVIDDSERIVEFLDSFKKIIDMPFIGDIVNLTPFSYDDYLLVLLRQATGIVLNRLSYIPQLKDCVNNNDSWEKQMTCLVNVIQESGSQDLRNFVLTLLAEEMVKNEHEIDRDYIAREIVSRAYSSYKIKQEKPVE